MKIRTGLWPVLFLCSALFSSLNAQQRTASAPAISIVIDDMGKRLETGQRVLALPGPVACAFLPKARYTRLLAGNARAAGKEVMLHLPMDSVDRQPLDAGAVKCLR